ncbi:MAG: MFS transporter [Defluviitaleaceae bacterium]|nr:MFS transporter [Defluviitaleaceae bacterium]
MKYRFPRIELFDEHGLDMQTIRSLKLVIVAVAFGIINMNIVTGIAMASYFRSLGASDFIFGLLFAIGPVISPMQVVASYVLERTRKRKQLFLTFGLIQRMIWLPFGLVPFIIPMEYVTLRIWMVSLFLLISAFSGPFMNVSFLSLAADLVPAHIRGRYFAVRMRVFTIMGILGGIFTAWLLDSFPPFYSYAMVFTLAAIAGSMDILCFIGVKFPEMPKLPEGEKREKFFVMLKTVLANKPYMRFILFMTFWMFSINLSTPFILVHLREGVQLSNTLITIAVQILPNICSVLIVLRWGRILDSHGNKATMQLANGIMCFAPFLWIFTTNNTISIVFIMIIGLMQGLLIPAFDLGANNILIGHAPKVNRSMYMAVYFMFTSIIGVGLANATGGWLLENVFYIFENQEMSLLGVTLTRYSYLFALTAILRCVMIYIALPRMVKEDEEKAGNTAMGLLKDIIATHKHRNRRRWAVLVYRVRHRGR